MFFKRFFVKSLEQTLAKGDSLFKDEHYSDARLCYLDALEKVAATANSDQNRVYIQSMIAQCGDILAKMNILEAEAALRSANNQKAVEYLELSLELSDDVSIREKAEKLLVSITDFSEVPTLKTEATGKHSCSSCTPSHRQTPESAPLLPDHLHSHEQFQLFINTLPGDLPERYASLGEEFAEAYLLAQTDDSAKALNKFRQLLSADDNDIILYETALLEFKRGHVADCELLLRRALQRNCENPVCNLSLAQLLTDSGRLTEAAALLQSMMGRQIFYEQSLLMLADLHTVQGDQENAITLLSSGLLLPTLKKAAAERLVHILASLGRDDEAAYLAKTYLKGCC